MDVNPYGRPQSTGASGLGSTVSMLVITIVLVGLSILAGFPLAIIVCVALMGLMMLAIMQS